MRLRDQGQFLLGLSDAEKQRLLPAFRPGGEELQGHGGFARARLPFDQHDPSLRIASVQDLVQAGYAGRDACICERHDKSLVDPFFAEPAGAPGETRASRSGKPGRRNGLKASAAER
jgi:hypothetical protein